MRPWLVAIALVCLVGAATATATTPVFTSVTASTGDSFLYRANSESPNRVLTIPLSFPDAITQFALTYEGRNFLSLPTDVVTRLIPAVCVDCTCNNLVGGAAFIANTISQAPTLTQAGARTDTRITTVVSLPTTAEPTVRRSFVESIGLDRGARICLYAPGSIVPLANPGVLGLGFVTTSFNCATTPCATGLPNAVNNAANLFTAFLDGAGVAAVLARTQECRATVASVCTCFNPRTTIACCGGNLYDTTVYKCCGDSTIVRLGDGCPCTTDSQCTSTEPRCCFQTKFPELRNSTTGVLTNGTGTCYNPTVHRCCDTGARYDPGQDQCCAINGVQSLNVPCPCNVDSHCQGGQTADARNNDFICCRQVDPVPIEASSCSIYSNFPSGTGPYFSQRCLGQCIDPSFQLCCNGNSCRKEFEKCCNTTCCNNFVGACHRVQKGIPGQRYNTLNFVTNPSDPLSNVLVFERCTNIEQMTPIRAFWIFVLPTAFLAATFLGLAVALVFANKAAVRVFTWVERFIVAFAVLLSLLACPLYFSPLYKYGGVIALIAFWAIITAATRVRWINAVAIGALIFLQIYLYDPFHGSAYFNLAYWRIWIESPFAGATDPRSNGILHTTRMMFPNVTTTNSAQWCSRYYDYFVYDVQLRSFERDDNPLRTTFGYCSRGWVMALYLLSGFIFIASLILLLLAIISLVARFRKEVLEPVELEVRAVQDFAPVY